MLRVDDFIIRISIGYHYVRVILRDIKSYVFLMGLVRSNIVLMGLIKENVKRQWETNIFHSKAPAIRPLKLIDHNICLDATRVYTYLHRQFS